MVLLGLFLGEALAHPGKTDRQGGHRCRRGCGEWALRYGEYHLHDKDFRPIRVEIKGNLGGTAEMNRTIPIPETAPTPREEKQQQKKDPIVVVPGRLRESGYITVLEEQGFFPANPALALCAVILLVLLLLIRIRRRRGRH